MPLVKASQARTRTLEGIKRQKEREQDRARELAEKEAEAKRLAESQRIQKATVTKQRKLLIRSCVLAAAQGDFYIVPDQLATEVSSYLLENRLGVGTVKKDLGILRTGLFEAWGFKAGPITDHANVLEPLYRLVMICIVEAWRSRDNKKEEIRQIASVILRHYQEDLSKKDFVSLHKKFKRLKYFSSDNQRPTFTLSDLFHTRADHHVALEVLDDEVFEISMSPSRERQFFEIVNSIFTILDVEVHLQGVEDGLLAEADGLSSELIKSLFSHSEDSITVSWWHEHLIRFEEPESLAQELWWLSSDHGQLFLNQLKDRIETAAYSGEDTLAVTAVHEFGESVMVPILSQYLEYMDYQVKTEKLSNEDVSIKISW